MKIYLIAGYAGSGKSTVCEILEKLLANSQPLIAAFAAAVKNEVATIYNIPRYLLDTQEGKKMLFPAGEIYKSGRQLLIEHSAYMKTLKGPNVWADIVASELQSGPNTCIIHDWRYKNEFAVLKQKIDAEIITIRVIRDHIVPLSDPSEHDLDDFVFDIYIANNGTLQDLENSLKSLVIV